MWGHGREINVFTGPRGLWCWIVQPSCFIIHAKTITGLIWVYSGCVALNGNMTVRPSLCKTRLTLLVLEGIVCVCVWERCERLSVCVWFRIRPAHLGPNTIIPKITESQLKHAHVRQKHQSTHTHTHIHSGTHAYVQLWPDSAEMGPKTPFEPSDGSLRLNRLKSMNKQQDADRKKLLQPSLLPQLILRARISPIQL